MSSFSAFVLVWSIRWFTNKGKTNNDSKTLTYFHVVNRRATEDFYVRPFQTVRWVRKTSWDFLTLIQASMTCYRKLLLLWNLWQIVIIKYKLWSQSITNVNNPSLWPTSELTGINRTRILPSSDRLRNHRASFRLKLKLPEPVTNFPGREYIYQYNGVIWPLHQPRVNCNTTHRR